MLWEFALVSKAELKRHEEVVRAWAKIVYRRNHG